MAAGTYVYLEIKRQFVLCFLVSLCYIGVLGEERPNVTLKTPLLKNVSCEWCGKCLYLNLAIVFCVAEGGKQGRLGEFCFYLTFRSIVVYDQLLQ